MGGGSSAVLIEKTITENGTYNAVDDEADGYSTVNVEVANTYTNEDEGKVVDNGVLVAQTTMPQTVTENGSITTTLYNSVTIDVPNTYTNEDEGKVVSNNELVAQTARETEITENGTYDTTLNNSITVSVASPAPAPVGTKSGAVIRDYDGSIIASYTPAQFAALSAYPAQPVHTGLTGQGYNWSLAGAKAYVAKYGYVEVGATYITDDGKTRYYILISEANTEGTVSLGLNGTAVIDWGDGSETDTITGEDVDTQIDTTHTYTTVGKYTITINVTNGSASLMGIQDLTLGKVEIGSGVTSIGYSAFYECYALTSITIPEEVTYIGESTFYGCQALSSITIPEGVTYIGESTFVDCYALTSITIPEGVTYIGGSAFLRCIALSSIIIPEGVTEISDSAFNGCVALSSIIIPEEVTYISERTFNDCQALSSIIIPEGVTSIGDQAFGNCSALSSIIIPEEVTYISERTFYDCRALTSITIPEGITSISDYAFYECYALTSITIPEGVTEISNEAFYECRALTSITFEPTTPPTIGTSTFESINPFCTIYVPTGTLEAYTTAENYPDPTIYTYVEY